VREYLSREALQRYEQALTETVMNAIEHGNLAINFQEKAEAIEEGTYLKLVQSRSTQARASEKRVHIRITVGSRDIITEVEDDGEGFDTSSLKSVAELVESASPNGWGIPLVEGLVDGATISPKGNCVTLVMHRKDISQICADAT
jgi:hypothetical protein